MPKFLEDKLKREYGANSSIPYKVMNSIGAMRGNKETAKGAAMEAKHERDVKKKKKVAPKSHEESLAGAKDFAEFRGMRRKHMAEQ